MCSVFHYFVYVFHLIRFVFCFCFVATGLSWWIKIFITCENIKSCSSVERAGERSRRSKNQLRPKSAERNAFAMSDRCPSVRLSVCLTVCLSVSNVCHRILSSTVVVVVVTMTSDSLTSLWRHCDVVVSHRNCLRRRATRRRFAWAYRTSCWSWAVRLKHF